MSSESVSNVGPKLCVAVVFGGGFSPFLLIDLVDDQTGGLMVRHLVWRKSAKKCGYLMKKLFLKQRLTTNALPEGKTGLQRCK